MLKQHIYGIAKMIPHIVNIQPQKHARIWLDFLMKLHITPLQKYDTEESYENQLCIFSSA